MERNVQRVNGSVEHLHSWSPDEIQAAIGSAVLRFEVAAQDITTLESELIRRTQESANL